MRPFREFLVAVAAMRQLQIAYSKDHAPSIFRKAAKFEYLVDKMLEDYKKENIAQKQFSLFQNEQKKDLVQ